MGSIHAFMIRKNNFFIGLHRLGARIEATLKINAWRKGEKKDVNFGPRSNGTRLISVVKFLCAVYYNNYKRSP